MTLLETVACEKRDQSSVFHIPFQAFVLNSVAFWGMSNMQVLSAHGLSHMNMPAWLLDQTWIMPS